MLSNRFLSLSLIYNIRIFRPVSEAMSSKATAAVKIEYLQLKDGKTLAYEKLLSSKSNSKTVIYVPGFQSGKDGAKVSYLRQFCLEHDFSFIR